jgi:hypothetical protein
MERTGQCHCGALRVIATGEPDRVYLCHCKACQRRTGTAFHFGATFWKERVRLDGGAEGLRTRRRQRLSHSISFLPELRHDGLLGGRPQSRGLRGRRGRVRQGGLSTAQRLDLGRVDVFVARPAAEIGASSAGPTTGHVSRFRPNRSCSQERRHLLFRVAGWLAKSWTRWHLPGDGPQPYAVYVDENDAVWVRDWGRNAILRFDPKTEKFESFPLPDYYASVRQLAGRRGEVWGAESRADKLFMLKSE